MDGESVSADDDWAKVPFHSFGIPVHRTWPRSEEAEFVFGSERARVHAAYVGEGALVDPARARRAERALAATAAAVEAALVSVAGRPAVRLTAQADGAALLEYVVGLEPRLEGGAVVYPEVTLVYVASGPSKAKLEEVRRILGEESLEGVLAGQPISQDGHLEFGPVPVPVGWCVDGKGEKPLESSEGSVEPFVPVWVGGGYLFIHPQERTDRGVLFQPLCPLTSSGSSESERALAVRTMLARSFPTMTLEACEAVAVPFGAGRGCSYLLSLGGFRRRGFVWEDVLGYGWELVYLLDEESWNQMSAAEPWRRLLTVQPSESGPFGVR